MQAARNQPLVNRALALAVGAALLFAPGPTPTPEKFAPRGADRSLAAASVDAASVGAARPEGSAGASPTSATAERGRVGAVRLPAAERDDRPETTGEVVVAFTPGGRAGAEGHLLRQGARIVRVDADAGFIVAEPPAGSDDGDFASAASELDGVRYAEPVYIRRAAYVPNDPMFGSQWALSRVGAPAAWDITRGDPGVRVAVIDTGIDLTHPDLAANLDTANDWDFVDNDATAQDEQGHGTHVAGIVGAVADNGIGVSGLASGCTILPVRVLDDDGYGTTTDVASGIRWAVDHGADVINLSLGSEKSSQLEREACEYAAAAGCTVVAAAGNTPGYSVMFPARYPSVLAVSATMSNDRAYAGNFGPQVDLAAPGAGILSTALRTGFGSDYEQQYGTSMATPLVAASAALLASEHPDWSPEEISATLKATARDLGPTGHDDTFGFGMVRPDQALAISDPPSRPSKGDNNIPGAPLPATTISGDLQSPYDHNDVFTVTLQQNDSLDIDLTAESSSADISVSLYGPGAVDVDLGTALVSATGPEQPRAIRFKANESGDYHVRVLSRLGSGTYTLTVAKTGVSLLAPERATWGDTVSIVAQATQAGLAAGGISITLEEKVAGGTWTRTETRQTVADGRATFTRAPQADTQYRTSATIGGTKRTSAVAHVALEPTVTVLLSRTSTQVGKWVSIFGEFTPKRPVVETAVRIDCYRDGSLVKSVQATDMSAIRPGAYSRYRTWVQVDAPGTWEFRAIIAALPGIHGEFESAGASLNAE